jgi:hypothetical protein
MPGEQLTVHNVEILTATVEIAILKVGGRQVTQAIFRQIPGEDPSMAQDTRLWGWVNYHHQCAPRDHRHVLWQKGFELRTGVVRDVHRFPSRSGLPDSPADDLWSTVLELPQLYIAV